MAGAVGPLGPMRRGSHDPPPDWPLLKSGFIEYIELGALPPTKPGPFGGIPAQPELPVCGSRPCDSIRGSACCAVLGLVWTRVASCCNGFRESAASWLDVSLPSAPAFGCANGAPAPPAESGKGIRFRSLIFVGAGAS
eukprot:scaffold131396_cov46-Tisochrysis_lutea.AAC.1